MNTSTQQQYGITALIAVVIMSVAMTAALAIFQVLFSESLIARDQEYSIIAEYAAEAGMECAKYNIHALDYDVTGNPTLYCNGSALPVAAVGDRTYTYPMTKNSACAVITLSYYDDNTAGIPAYRHIDIQSRGRYPCVDPRVERGIEAAVKRGL